MAGSWRIQVFENQVLVFPSGGRPNAAVEVPAGRLEIGRQQVGEPAPFAMQPQADCVRLILARLRDGAVVSRRHALVVATAAGRVQVQNLSTSLPVGLSTGQSLAPGGGCELDLPVLLTLGNKSLRIEDAESFDDSLHSLQHLTIAPGRINIAETDLSTIASSVGPVEIGRLLPWLRTVMEVLQSAAGTEDFFERAARAVVNMVGLDSCRVLLFVDGGWQEAAFYTALPDAFDIPRDPSQQVLEKVRREKRTYWRSPAGAVESKSLLAVQAVVAAPILDRTGAVLGVLYGDQGRSGMAMRRPLSELEAALTELLAGGVAAGLARLEMERSAAALRVQFEQFFTPQLARQLMEEPDLLTGRLAQVSILFCDIRNYSGISRRLGPSETLGWVQNVLGLVSESVLSEDGVLVDYVGDAVMAMWGAPKPQNDHARRAGRAALSMLRALPKLNERWEAVLGERTRLGIGINSGEALVGNIGSPQKFKYGALGNTVNLASRVQGLTKYLKTDLLVTGATYEQLGAEFPGRRVCSVRVMNIPDSVPLYELIGTRVACEKWVSLYEQALADFENRQFAPAARSLTNLLSDYPGDGPSLVLLSRAVSCLVEEPVPFAAIWEPPSK